MARDIGGSVHVLEVMIVGVMMIGAVVFVATMDQPVHNPETNRAPLTDDAVDNILEVYLALPPTTDAVHYANRLEQLVVEHIISDPVMYQRYVAGSTEVSTLPHQSEMERQFSLRGNHESFRVELAMDRKQWFISGPEGHYFDIPATGEARWLSQVGHTFVVPTLSTYNTGQLVTAEVLPAWMKGVHSPPGVAYEVTALIEKGGQEIRHEGTHHIRLPTDQDRNAFTITPFKPNGDEGFVFAEEDLGSGDGGVVWESRFRFQPAEAGARWMHDGVVVQLKRPPGWSEPELFTNDPALGSPHGVGWKLLNEDPEDPVWRLQYTGPVLRDEGEAWLNFTMKRGVDKLSQHHHMMVQVEYPSWSQAVSVLTPDSATKKMPGLVFVSHSDPLPKGKVSKMMFTVINPYDELVLLQGLQVRFDGLEHELLPDGTYLFEEASPGVSDHGLDDLPIYLEDATGVTLPASGAMVFELRVLVEQEIHAGIGMGRAPLVEYIGDGYQLPGVLEDLVNLGGHDAMVGVPYGHPGQYMAWFDPGVLGQGWHTLRVPMQLDRNEGAPEGIPPGLGHFEVRTDPHPVLPVLQDARHSMGLRVSPAVHAPGEPLRVGVKLGELLPVLRELYDEGQGELLSDVVRLRLSSASLVEQLGGRVENELFVDLGLDWAVGIVGLSWVEPGGWGPWDLGVGYSDGRIVLLDGGGLPGTVLWSVNVGDTVTAGPFWLKGNENVDDVFAVFAERGGESFLVVLDPVDGGVLDSVPLGGGVVREGLVTRCLGGPDGLGFIVESGLLDGAGSAGSGGVGSVGELLGLGLSGEGLVIGGGVAGLGGSPGLGVNHYRAGELWNGGWFSGYALGGLDVGRFGPTAECGLVVGMDHVVDGGSVVRFGLEDGDEVWRQEVPEGVLGVYAGRVKQAPYEGLLNDLEVDQVVVVTGDGGYRVLDGFVEMGLGGESNFDLGLGDGLVGLSWVDDRVGYVASKMGFVWKTDDGGMNWELVAGNQPVVRDDRVLVSFGTGGKGKTLFLDDDDHVLEYEGDAFPGDPEWKEIPGVSKVHGLLETRNNPAILAVRQDWDETGLYEWNYEEQRALLENPILSAPCTCETGGTGIEHAIAVWDDDDLFVNSTMGSAWSGAHESLIYSVNATGTVLSLKNTNGLYLVKQNGETKEMIRLNADLDEVILEELRAGRNPTGAYLLYGAPEGAGLLALTGDDFLHHAAPGSGLVDLSGGPGGLWWVTSDQVIPASQPQRHSFKVQSPLGFSTDEVSLELSIEALENDPDSQGVQWRVLSAGELTGWQGLDGLIELEWEEGLLVEVKHTGLIGGGFSGPVLGVSPDGGPQQNWVTQTDSACSGCMVPIADEGFLLMGGPVWLDPGGLLPGWHSSAGLGSDHAFSKHGEGESFLVGGSGSDGVWSHNLTLGLPWKDHGLGDPLLPSTLHRIPGAMGDVVLWVQGEVGNVGLLNLVPGVHEIYQLDPATGASCEFSDKSARGLEGRVFAHHPESGAFVMGSDLGRITARSASIEACHQLWSGEASQVGSVLQFTLPTNRTALPGPTIVQAELVLEVDGLEEVSLNLLGHSFRSRNSAMPSIVHFNVNLQYYFPPLYFDPGEMPEHGLRVLPDPKDP